jgi:hypothetical protein
MKDPDFGYIFKIGKWFFQSVQGSSKIPHGFLGCAMGYRCEAPMVLT